MPEEVDKSAFKWIRARPCPICGKPIKHLETHTRIRLQAEIFEELPADYGYRRKAETSRS